MAGFADSVSGGLRENGDGTLRVLVVAPSFGAFGGIQAVMIRLARELDAEADLDVTLCFKRVKGTTFKPSLVDTVADTGVKALYVDRLSVALLRAIYRSDIVHVQTPSPDVAVAARLFRKPLVMTIYNWRSPQRPLRRATLGVASRLASVRTYISDFVWSTWEPARRRANSIKLPVLSELPAGFVDPEERIGFLFVARLIENKGLEVLLEAYRRAEIDHHKWPLTVVGEGPLRPLIEARVQDQKITGVELKGFIDDESKHELIRRAKWMVTPPHHNEDLGLTPIEARHVGVPCIVTRDGGLLEAAGNFALSCEPANVDELRALLEHAARMPDSYYELLAHASHAELLEYLKPMSVYGDLYRQVAAAESV